MNGPDYAAMFRNKLIEPGEYLAKLIGVQQIATDDGKLIYQVEVVLGHNESVADGARLSAVLQPSEKGQRFIAAFLESYRVTEQTVKEGIGRYAAVYIYQSQYKGTHFSQLKFHAQPFTAQQIVEQVEAEEAVARKKKLVTSVRVASSCATKKATSMESPSHGYIDWNAV